MHLLNLQPKTAQENLLLDEHLLNWANTTHPISLLRFWTTESPCVVVGYGNRILDDVNLHTCQSLGIPILRRCSGGGTVLISAGCLNYSIILRMNYSPQLTSIEATNSFVMTKQLRAVNSVCNQTIKILGTTDLTLNQQKFSGNAQRRKQFAILFHGTFLLNSELELIYECLKVPQRQPDYRCSRSHKDFLTNLKIDQTELQNAIIQEWGAKTLLDSLQLELDSGQKTKP